MPAVRPRSRRAPAAPGALTPAYEQTCQVPLAKRVTTAAHAFASLDAETDLAARLRDTAAMRLLDAGNDIIVIASSHGRASGWTVS